MAVLSKHVIAYFAALILVLIVGYFATGGFKLPSAGHTTTIAGGGTTTISNGPTTSTTTQIFVSNCSMFTQFTQNTNSVYGGQCLWAGGPLALWAGAGNTGSESVKIVGADNHVYLNQTSTYQCVTFYSNFTLPAQTYTITFRTGLGAKNQSVNCTTAIMKINKTLSPPQIVYQTIYNGNFGNGQYTGWTQQGAGFGAKPLNVSFANNGLTYNGVSANSPVATNNTGGCYPGTKWRNYNFTYFATTFNCGTTVAPGNLTSSLFYANKPFLNFRIISPQDNFLYVEILYNNTPYVIVHYNTFNVSTGNNCPVSGATSNTANATQNCAKSTFRNATIPLATVAGKPIRVEVVADTLLSSDYIAMSGFGLSSTPHSDKGIIYGNINFTH